MMLSLFIVLFLTGTWAMIPHMSPFFFLCNYHGNVQELGISQGEISLSVTVSGDPEYYVPGMFYKGKALQQHLVSSV